MAVPFLFAAGVAVRLLRRAAGRRALLRELQLRASSTCSSRRASTTASPPPSCWRWALVFQVPVVILGATRAGIVTPRQLRKVRRYAIVACAAVAAFLPGDAITLLLETVPLYLLYEVEYPACSVRRRARARERTAEAAGGRRAPTEDPAAADRRTSGANRAADHRPRRPRPVRLMLFDLRGRGRRRHGPRHLHRPGAADGRRPGRLRHRRRLRRRRHLQRRQQQRRRRRRELLQPDHEVPQADPSNRRTRAPGKSSPKPCLHEAGGEPTQRARGLTSKGKELYNEASQAWNALLALNPPKPTPNWPS